MKKRHVSKLAPLAGVAALLTPALAKAADYNYNTDYSTNAAGGAAAAGVIGFVLVFYIIFLVVALGFFIFWIIMLIDAFKRTNWEDENQKNLWLILLIVSIFIGLAWLSAILYYFIIKRALDKKPAAATPAAKPAEPTKK